jgi:hypothetical protein
MTLGERRRRAYCTCPNERDDPGLTDSDPCLVHIDGEDLAEAEREALGLWFFDDRRSRHVGWADAVEAMRQRRYAGAINRYLVLHTWGTLIRLIEALRDPFGSPSTVITAEQADELIHWAGDHLHREEQRWLLGFARGGGADALIHMFRSIARRAVDEPRDAMAVTSR